MRRKFIGIYNGFVGSIKFQNGGSMKTITIFKISSMLIFLGVSHSLLSKTDRTVELFIVNRVPDIGFIVGMGAKSKCGNQAWNTRQNLPNGPKLMQSHGRVLMRACDAGGSWENLFIDVINKNNKHTRISVPSALNCIDTVGFGGCDADRIIIIFTKNSAGQVEVHRARLDYSGNELEDMVLKVLTPELYF